MLRMRKNVSEFVILGKKGYITKFDLHTNKPIWTSLLFESSTPTAMAQYGEYILVTTCRSWKKGHCKKICCFRETTGQLLWTHNSKDLLCHHYPLIPSTLDGHFYYLSSPHHVSKIAWETGQIMFHHRFHKKALSSWISSTSLSHQLIIAGDEVMLISNKEVLIVDKASGRVRPHGNGNANGNENGNANGKIQHLGKPAKTNAIEGATCILRSGRGCRCGSPLISELVYSSRSASGVSLGRRGSDDEKNEGREMS